ncbi:primosomal protein N' [soil metagenome]
MEGVAKEARPVDSVTLMVAVEAPQHSGLEGLLGYLADHAFAPGTLVRVPLRQRDVPGIVWPPDTKADDAPETAAAEFKLRPIAEALVSLSPLSASWCALVGFAAAYYQRSVGEMALSVLPPDMRKASDAQLAKRIAKLLKTEATRKPNFKVDEDGVIESPEAPTALPDLSIEQAAALDESAAKSPPGASPVFLLHGVTGSGKTEVYLRSAARALDQGRQALVLVPEINLTPQLEARFIERFKGRRIVSLHSALTPVQRLNNWLMAHLGLADLVLGTRLAVFASMPRLGLIVVDEEHDPSYKQQEGARYSARDLAVYRGRLEGIPVILGSATPSLESWQRSIEGRYTRLTMAARIGGGALPRVRLVDMNMLPKGRGVGTALSAPLVEALQLRLERGEQSLVFLNRRGYAPVLHCTDCGWKSGCPNCSAWRVFHKRDRTLRCHHCGFTEAVPRACPDCGNLDIAPMGRGTERLEEQLAQVLPGARVSRIDADTTRLKGSLEAQMSAVHAGEVDVLVGTQMVTKGHDFRRITLVAAVNPDSSLFSSDFRAPERLFALLMQAAGRAGRDAEAAARSEMWIQTWSPRHALYTALRKEDFAGFAESQLEDRRIANMPPFSHLALIRAEARTPEIARDFLQAGAGILEALPGAEVLFVYAPVPTAVARVANIERMQMLIESSSRVGLQSLLASWLPLLHELRPSHKGLLRWAIDVDPLAI